MQISARNQLHATVDTVTHGEVMSTVRVTLPDGQHITAAGDSQRREGVR